MTATRTSAMSSPTPPASTTEVWQIPGIEELVRPSLRQSQDKTKSKLLSGISDDDDTHQGSSTAGCSDSASGSSDLSQGSDCAASDDGTELCDYPPYGHHHPQAHAAVVPGDYAYHYRRRQQLSHHQQQQPAALVVDPCYHQRTVHVPRTTPNHAKVFVGGLPNEVRNLKQYFEGHGEVVDHIVMIDRASKRSRGFGFVTFAREVRRCLMFFRLRLMALAATRTSREKLTRLHLELIRSLSLRRRTPSGS